MEINLDSVNQKIYEAATLFNKIASDGKSITDFNKKTLYSKIESQYGIAREEVDETLLAIKTGDVVECVDGYIDSVFTVAPFYEMLLQYSKLNGNFDIFEPFQYGFSYRTMTNDFNKKVLPFFKNYDVSILNKAADLIIENNQQKFTTSKEEFDSWESEFIRKELIVDGVKYYTLVDENGKIRKRNNFPKVDLSFVLDDV